MYFSINDPISTEMMIGIQVEKTNQETPKFSNNDEMNLEIITKFLAIELKGLSSKNELVETIKKNKETLILFEDILAERTIYNMINKLKSELATFMRFEKTNVLIHNLSGIFN